MRLPKKFLRVYPNPWGVSPAAVLNETPVEHSTLDHEGRPCGVVMADPVVDGGEPGRMVGARVCGEHTSINGREVRHVAGVEIEEIRSVRQRTVYSFQGCTAHETEPFGLAAELAKTDVITLPFSEYYRAEIASGGLIAADEETAEAAGVPFEEPKTLFAKLAKAAAKAFDAHFDEEKSAYEHFVGERRKTQEDEKKAAAEAKEAAAEARQAAKSPAERALDALKPAKAPKAPPAPDAPKP